MGTIHFSLWAPLLTYCLVVSTLCQLVLWTGVGNYIGIKRNFSFLHLCCITPRTQAKSAICQISTAVLLATHYANFPRILMRMPFDRFLLADYFQRNRIFLHIGSRETGLIMLSLCFRLFCFFFIYGLDYTSISGI